jgi:hypothetical protein
MIIKERTTAEGILNRLLNGEYIQGIDSNGRGVGLVYYNDGYIHWRHYGQSARQATVDGVMFILNTIFSECIDWSPCAFSEYHVNYIPLNKKYRGVDLSRCHPNTFGK